MINTFKTFFIEKMDMKSPASLSPAQKNIQVATCAILLEAAMADNELTREEIEHIHTALQHLYDMAPSDIEQLVQLTLKESKEAIDIWQFTNLINQNYNQQQKMLLMEHIWMVILSDGTLDKFEDYLARKLMPLLRLEHKQWINSKIQAKKKLQNMK